MLPFGDMSGFVGRCLFYIPLNLFGLITILGYNTFVNRKLEKTRRKIEEIEGAAEQSED